MLRRIGACVVWGMTLYAASGHAQVLPLARVPPPRYEAATIKPAHPDGSGAVGQKVLPGGRLRIGHGTLASFLALALDVEEFQITGGPDWVSRDRYDLEAVPSDTNAATHLHYELTQNERAMLQALLEERFHLKMSHTVRNGKIYRLVRGTRPLALEPTQFPDAIPNASVFSHGEIADGEMRGRNATMETIAREVRSYLRRPVVDETGISGHFDFWVKPFDAENKDLSVAVFGSLDRLGLKLVSAQGRVDAVVIESVTRPTEN